MEVIQHLDWLLSEPTSMPNSAPQINKSNYFAKDLQCCFVPWHNGWVHWDLTGRYKLVTTAGRSDLRVPFVSDFGGIITLAKDTRTSGDNWVFTPSVITDTPDGKGVSHALLYRQRTNNNYSYALLGNSSSTIYQIRAEDTLGSGQWFTGPNLGNHDHEPLTNEWLHSFMSHTPTFFARWLVNGVFTEEPTYDAVGSSLTFQYYGETKFSGSRGSIGDLAYFMVWKRNFSDAAMEDFNANPSQLFNF